ncbi:MAG: hypothetical protein E7Z91_06805 [Cyanobacteria bacterium SIG30]|nr:hypothetical protein [Cyanobacteria bacterium SIG30]
MRIRPVILNQNNLSNKGQLGNKHFSGKSSLNYQNQNDVFVRLAIASTRDQQIENELKTMNLI